ncbi:MAG: KamA family protein [Bacteroidales bacterium]|nr:KamA family protein [Bacteroidales bacterium]
MDLLKYSISPRAKRQLMILLNENPVLKRIISMGNPDLAKRAAKLLLWKHIRKRPQVHYYLSKERTRELFSKLTWSDYAIIRMSNYLKFSGIFYEDLNMDEKKSLSDPMLMLWLAYNKGIGGAKRDFFLDMVHLFRQARSTKTRRRPSKEDVIKWMEHHPSGLDKNLIEIREENKNRIIQKFVELHQTGFYKPSSKFFFAPEATFEEKLKTVNKWWNQHQFHLRYAIRDYNTLNYFLDNTLSEGKLEIFEKATKKGLPFFINFYYLSLLNVHRVEEFIGSDMPIRDYIFYNKDLINEFGRIVAWEKEDQIMPRVPNAAGWFLPNDHNIHRRYPETAIFIPDTMGRSCGGLCVSCQRMYDFQKGHLNFNLDKLSPRGNWVTKLRQLLNYFESDTQLRDILITGGDSLMSSNNSLRIILNEVLHMIERKNQQNELRPQGKKYAPIERVRLGTRMLVYIPQRIDDELVEILADFRNRAVELGVKRFVIQTHFITAMEITPQAEKASEKILNAGWMITNQAVFTTAVSRKGHVAKLRAELNKIGILPYYTFSVKGYRENRYNFATNARLAQEIFEEKIYGQIDDSELEVLLKSNSLKKDIRELMIKNDKPFLSTDRSIMNLPAVGKSLTFGTIGITNDGRRILRFRHDTERNHSPVVAKGDQVIIVESKSVNDYIQQLEKKGEFVGDYETLFGYSMFITEKRKKLFSFVVLNKDITKELNHIKNTPKAALM